MRNKESVETSVVLPTYNERENIGKMVEQIFGHVKNAEVIVVDDDSPDGTWKIVEEMKTAHPTLHLIHRKKEKGVASALMTGLKSAEGRYLVWMDADLGMPPSLIPRMISLMENNDVVIGSRYVSGGKDDRVFVRVATSRAINILSNVILSFRVRDWTTGFVAVKKEVFKRVGFNPEGHGEYCIEFLYKCLKKGYKIGEIGFVFKERASGASKTSRYAYSLFLYGFRYVWRVLRVRFS